MWGTGAPIWGTREPMWVTRVKEGKKIIKISKYICYEIYSLWYRPPELLMDNYTDITFEKDTIEATINSLINNSILGLRHKKN